MTSVFHVYVLLLSKHCQSGCRQIQVPRGSTVMMKFMVNYRTETWKTHINLLNWSLNQRQMLKVLLSAFHDGLNEIEDLVLWTDFLFLVIMILVCMDWKHENDFNFFCFSFFPVPRLQSWKMKLNTWKSWLNWRKRETS